MSNLIDLKFRSVNIVMNILLKDRTTNKNIIFATDAYDNIDFTTQITKKILFSDFIDIRPRVSKTLEEQNQRTRKKRRFSLLHGYAIRWIIIVIQNGLDMKMYLI